MLLLLLLLMMMMIMMMMMVHCSVQAFINRCLYGPIHIVTTHKMHDDLLT